MGSLICLWMIVVLFQDPSDIDPRVVDELISQLGDDDVQVRERAQQKLVKLGFAVKEHVKKATESKDPEVRARASAILHELRFYMPLGDYSSRTSKKSDYVSRSGGGKDTEEAVLDALRWLARHQSADGSWQVTKHVERCADAQKTCSPNPGAATFDVGVTGLVLLAFLGAGYTHLSKDRFDGICFGTVVDNGVQYLMKLQHPTGRLGADNLPKHMYNHLIAATALVEASGMTKSAMIKDAAQKSVDYSLQAQNPGRGWRYSFRSGDNDSSVTGWGAVMLRAAVFAGLKVNAESSKGILAWYEEVTANEYCRTGYNDGRVGKVVIPNVNEKFSDHATLTAMGIVARLSLSDAWNDPVVQGGMKLIVEDIPTWDPDGLKVDFYYWLHAGQAVLQFDGPDGPEWKRWNEKIKAALLTRQNKTPGECRHGSWDPVDRWSSEAGRIYTTASGALILETYYRCPRPIR